MHAFLREVLTPQLLSTNYSDIHSALRNNFKVIYIQLWNRRTSDTTEVKSLAKFRFNLFYETTNAKFRKKNNCEFFIKYLLNAKLSEQRIPQVFLCKIVAARTLMVFAKKFSCKIILRLLNR